MLDPDEAAPIAGVPALQLRRWAYLGVGPRNSGTKWRPKYLEEDVIAWHDQAVLLGIGDDPRKGP